MEILRIIKEKNGQSLVEVTISFGLIVAVLGGLFSLFFGSIGLLLEAQNKTVAYNLAAEGIEAVRQARNEGCSFSDQNIISASGSKDASKTLFINKDIVGVSPANTGLTLPYDETPGRRPSSDFRIDFSGTKFQRRIYLYSVDNPDLNSQFPTDAAHSFDWRSKFFIAEVEITWTGKLGSGTFVSTKTLVREWKNT